MILTYHANQYSIKSKSWHCSGRSRKEQSGCLLSPFAHGGSKVMIVKIIMIMMIMLMTITIMTMLTTMAMTIGNADDNAQAPVAPRLPRQHHGSLQLLEREESPQWHSLHHCSRILWQTPRAKIALDQPLHSGMKMLLHTSWFRNLSTDLLICWSSDLWHGGVANSWLRFVFRSDIFTQ